MNQENKLVEGDLQGMLDTIMERIERVDVDSLGEEDPAFLEEFKDELIDSMLSTYYLLLDDYYSLVHIDDVQDALNSLAKGNESTLAYIREDFKNRYCAQYSID